MSEGKTSSKSSKVGQAIAGTPKSTRKSPRSSARVHSPATEPDSDSSTEPNNQTGAAPKVSWIVPSTGNNYWRDPNSLRGPRLGLDNESPIDPELDGPINSRWLGIRATAKEEVRRYIMADGNGKQYRSIYHYNDDFEISQIRDEPSAQRMAGRPIECEGTEASGLGMQRGHTFITASAPVPRSTQPINEYADYNPGEGDYSDVANFPDPSQGIAVNRPAPPPRQPAASRKRNSTASKKPSVQNEKYTWDHDKLMSTPGQLNGIILEKRPTEYIIRNPVRHIEAEGRALAKVRAEHCAKEARDHEEDLEERSRMLRERRNILQLAHEALKSEGIIPESSASLEEHPTISRAVGEFLNGGDQDDHDDEDESFRRFIRTAEGEQTRHSNFDASTMREMLIRFGHINHLVYAEQDDVLDLYGRDHQYDILSQPSQETSGTLTPVEEEDGYDSDSTEVDPNWPQLPEDQAPSLPPFSISTEPATSSEDEELSTPEMSDDQEQVFSSPMPGLEMSSPPMSDEQERLSSSPEPVKPKKRTPLPSRRPAKRARISRAVPLAK
ncbi:hypothetical protein HYFRA_00012541 [Hymenoscyphus fraxineus]|uniref:Uncharacterized protein n=1 Tax=Hymenoscyphus fraxineus TaxID=746836 RepID=A0A9N9L4Z6_9HELO|nr:hypothetical protein HYFRA_00012541 [Hymenoscyphus fraxineus]